MTRQSCLAGTVELPAYGYFPQHHGLGVCRLPTRQARTPRSHKASFDQISEVMQQDFLHILLREPQGQPRLQRWGQHKAMGMRGGSLTEGTCCLYYEIKEYLRDYQVPKSYYQ